MPHKKGRRGKGDKANGTWATCGAPFLMKKARSPVVPRFISSNVTSKDLRYNAILAALEGPEIAAVIEHGTLVTLPVRYAIYQPGERIKHSFFPIDCVLSVVTRMLDGQQIEVGTIGREGVSAIPLLLGATTSANESYCQVPGTAIKIDATLFASLKTNAAFVLLLDRYVQAYVNMLGQLAACNRLHNVYERCARWLLMTQDRVEEHTISLTHEYLAMMLGTERSGVTIAAGTLQKAGFITYGLGMITILDRSGLEGASCECYAIARAQFGGFLRSANSFKKFDAAVPISPTVPKRNKSTIKRTRGK